MSRRMSAHNNPRLAANTEAAVKIRKALSEPHTKGAKDTTKSGVVNLSDRRESCSSKGSAS